MYAVVINTVQQDPGSAFHCSVHNADSMYTAYTRTVQFNQSINQSRIFRVVQVIKSLQDPPEVGNNLESYSVAPVAHDEMRNYQLSEQRIKSSRGHTSQKLSFLRCIF